MPLQKNQVLTLTIERLSNDGSGVAHSPDGEAVFVPGTAPGDEADVRIVKDCGRYAFGILDSLRTPSPDRIPVDCAVAGPCGGCSLRHLDYAAELRAKQESVTDVFRRIGGLDVPTSGKVIVDGKELSALNDEQLTIFRRRKIGFIFQNYNLVPMLNVYENIVLPVELDGDKADKKFMDEVVRMLALEDKLNNLPNNLSGGQQQRVAIARALISKPAIVLADEPTGNLDSRTSSDVLGLLKVTSQKFHQTLVMITHNSEIAQLADRIIRIEDGRIVL